MVWRDRYSKYHPMQVIKMIYGSKGEATTIDGVMELDIDLGGDLKGTFLTISEYQFLSWVSQTSTSTFVVFSMWKCLSDTLYVNTL